MGKCRYPLLFTPLTIKKTTFRNRIFASPNMLVGSTPSGAPCANQIGYYAEKAKGGAAMVTIGDTPVDMRYGAPGPSTHLRFDRVNAAAFNELSDAIHEGGAVACFELNHPGRTANKARNLKIVSLRADRLDHTAHAPIANQRNSHRSTSSARRTISRPLSEISQSGRR